MWHIKMNPKRWIFLSVGLVCLTLWVLYYTFEVEYVCAHCGATKSSLELKFPLSNITVCPLRSHYSYMFSEALTARGLVEPHPHQWLYCSGGNRLGCGPGVGSHLKYLCQPKTLKFLDDTLRFQGKSVTQKWAALIFTLGVYSIDGVVNYPLEGLPTLKAYQDWQTANFLDVKDPRLLALLPPLPEN